MILEGEEEMVVYESAMPGRPSVAGQIEAAAVPLLKAMTDRGINEVQANRLLRSLPSEAPPAQRRRNPQA